MGKFVHGGGITLAWVSFLLEQLGEGENNHGVMILLGQGGSQMKKILLLITCFLVAGCAVRDFVPSGL
jgi:hypothetical protein